MFLIIYDKSDLGTLDYIEYLKIQKYDFYSIEASELVNNYAIKDCGDKCILQSYNHKKKTKIDFDDVRGVYYRLHELKSNYFENYTEEDKNYVRKEWESYLAYRIYNTKNAINRPNLMVLSSLIMQYPFYYSIAQESGLNIPYYHVSSNYKDLQKVFENKECEYIARSSVYNTANFKTVTEINENIYGLIEKPKGELILVDVVGDKVFASRIDEKRTIIKVDEINRQKLLLFSKNLGLSLMQAIMIQDNNQLVLMYLTAYPNWTRQNIKNKLLIYQKLTRLLSLR